MEKWRNVFLTNLLLCCSFQLNAQWDSPIIQYWEVIGYYNPSYIGINNNINTTAVYSHQLAGIEGAPHSTVFTADMPFMLLNKRHGAGITAHSENIGSLRNTLLSAQYSFKQQIGTGFLNIGLQAGIYNINYDAGALILITDPDNNNLKKIRVNSTKKQTADLSAGISWTGKKLHIGLSSIHINQPGFYVSSSLNNTNNSTNNLPNYSLKSDSIKSQIPRTFNFFAGYNIPIFYSLEIQPMVLLLSNNNNTYTQSTVRLEYDNKYSGGFSWISEDGYSIFAGTTVKCFSLGYAYTMHKSGFGKESKGSHELFLKYSVSIDDFKQKPQPHKSIRLL